MTLPQPWELSCGADTGTIQNRFILGFQVFVARRRGTDPGATAARRAEVFGGRNRGGKRGRFTRIECSAMIRAK